MQCPRCQFDLGAFALESCPQCGADLSSGEDSAAAPEKSRWSRAHWISLFVLGGVAIGLALAALFWALAQKPPRPADRLVTEETATLPPPAAQEDAH